MEAKELLKGVFTDLACLYGYLLKKGFTEKFSTQKTFMENKMAAVGFVVLEYKHDHPDDRRNRFNMRYVEMANL